MLGVHCSAKPLKGVIAGVRNLHIVYNSFAPYTTKSDAVDFVVRLKSDAWIFNPHIAQNTRVIVIYSTANLVTAAVKSFHRVNATFYQAKARRATKYLVGMGLAQNDQTAPVTVTWGSLITGEDNRLYGRTIGDEFTTAGHDQRTFGGFVSLDGGACFDG